MKQILENQIAVANYPYGKYSFEYALDSLERIGGKKMELYACDPHFHIDDLSPSDISAANYVDAMKDARDFPVVSGDRGITTIVDYQKLVVKTSLYRAAVYSACNCQKEGAFGFGKVF